METTSSDDVVSRIAWIFLEAVTFAQHKSPVGIERKRKTPREKFADKRTLAVVAAVASSGTRHCYINKRGSSRHRGFIGFQFALNRTLPFLRPPSPPLPLFLQPVSHPLGEFSFSSTVSCPATAFEPERILTKLASCFTKKIVKCALYHCYYSFSFILKRLESLI